MKDKRENTRTQSARRANSRQRQRRPGQARHKSGRTRRPGNNAAECGQRKAAEGRHDCGKPHAQPPGGGTSLHPGAASQTGQTAAAKAPHTQAHGRQTASRPRQRRPDTKAAGCPQAGDKTAAHRQKKRRGTGRKSPHNSGRPRKNGRPGRRRGALGAENPLRTGKIRVRSFACQEGPCEQGPPKIRFAVFGWHSLFLLRIAHSAARSTEQKGAPPPFIPCKLFEKSLTKNFTVLAG